MRLYCYNCGKCVSSEVPDGTVVRASLQCPECLVAASDDFDEWAKSQPFSSVSPEASAAEDGWKAAIERMCRMPR